MASSLHRSRRLLSLLPQYLRHGTSLQHLSFSTSAHVLAPDPPPPEPVPMRKLKDSFLYGTSSAYLEELEKRYQEDPHSVDKTWASFFQSLEQGVKPEAVAEAYHAFERGETLEPLRSASLTAQTVPESLKLMTLIRAYQVGLAIHQGHPTGKGYCRSTVISKRISILWEWKRENHYHIWIRAIMDSNRKITNASLHWGRSGWKDFLVSLHRLSNSRTSFRASVKSTVETLDTNTCTYQTERNVTGFANGLSSSVM